MTVIAEELRLLLLDDETGRRPAGLDLATVLGGVKKHPRSIVGGSRATVAATGSGS